MALSCEEKKRLLSVDAPAADEVRKQLNDYLSRTGLTLSDFARRISYSTMSLYMFTSGRYQRIAGNDKAIRAAIRNFIELNPVGQQTGADSGKLYKTENVKLLQRYFNDAIEHSLAYYVYGGPGCQKTHVLKWLVSEITRRELPKNGKGARAFYVYCRAGIRPSDLMKRIAESAGVSGAGNVDRIIRNLRFDLRGRKTLICFDEAQHLDNHCLEIVRELFDEPPHCGLLFAGSHDLKKIFLQLELEQWRSRIHAGKALPGISDEEAREIIAGELGEQSSKKVSLLIDSARVSDLRQGKDFKYISARRLFWSLRDIKGQESKGELDTNLEGQNRH
jgi:DNA transposition AAA+ family ATPase